MKSTNGAPQSSSVPDPDDVLAELRPLINLMIEGFEAGTMHTREYFEGQKIKPPLAAMLTRSKVEDYLRARGHQIEEFEQQDAPLIGLRVSVGKYEIRIWKSLDDAIPFGGASDTKRRYLDQEQYVQGRLFAYGEETAWLPIRLVVLWNVDAAFRFLGLHVTLPKRAPEEFDGETEVYWTRRCAHSVFSSQAGGQASGPVSGSDDLSLPFQDADEDEESASDADGTQ